MKVTRERPLVSEREWRQNSRSLKVLAAAVLSTSLLVSAARTNSDTKPMITKNRDGTFTIQKGHAISKDGKDKPGLEIPPQVVVPLVPGGKPRSQEGN